MGKPCWVLVYSALLVALFSGENFEDLIVGLTWPCTLPPGWSMVWDGSSAGADASTPEWCLVQGLSRCQSIVSYRVFTFRWINKLWWTVVVETSVALLSYFQNWSVIISNSAARLCDVWNACCCTLWTRLRVRFAYLIPVFHGFNQDFTRGIAEVHVSWTRVAFATMVSALI